MRLRIQRRKRQEAVCSFEVRCVLECSSAERTGMQFYQATEHLAPAHAELVRALLAGSVAATADDLRVVEALEQQVMDACAALRDYLCRASTYGTADETVMTIVTLEERTFSPGNGA